MIIASVNNFVTKLFPSFLWKIPNSNNKIYLTFDDGPIPEVTPWVLDTLNKYDIKATFFCVGNNVRKHPQIYEKVLKQGHSVGNHTYSHVNAFSSKADEYFKSVERASEYINSNIFRPPRGFMRVKHYRLLRQKYKAVMWTVLSVDYDKKLKPSQCVDNVVKNVTPGSIIVFHDSVKAWENMHMALPIVIEELLQKGYDFDVIPYEKLHG